MKKILLFAVSAFVFVSTRAQAPVSWSSADMYQAFKKLNVLGSVLYLAAHPDDENTRLIAYLSKDRLVRTGYLSLTRGDGGQNLVGDEQGIDLGLIRTQELLAARRVDGGEQFFTRAYDFGFSKNPEETFTKWDREKILADVVWVIRKFQPDIIITRFPTTGEGGHGHHTASAILANEAFSAAADRNRFPEQLKYVQPWQTKRVLWNTFNFGGTNTTREDQLKIDVGGYNPLLGKSYGEIAATSRSNHKSQGFGSAATRGEAIEYFKATKGDQPVTDLLGGVDITWNRVSNSATIARTIDSLTSSFDFSHPEKSVNGLVVLYRQLKQRLAQPLQRQTGSDEAYWLERKLEEVKQLIEQCSGLFIDITGTEPFAVQTDSIRVNFVFNNRLGAPLSLREVKLDQFDSVMNIGLVRNRNQTFSKTWLVPATKPITQPYWLAQPMEAGYFNVTDQEKIGQADVDTAYTVLVTVDVDGEPFTFRKPVRYKFTDPVKGELYEPLVVLPAILLNPSPETKIIINKSDPLQGELAVTARKKNMQVQLETDHYLIDHKEDPSVNFQPAVVSIAEKNQTVTTGFNVKTDSSSRIRFLAKDRASDYISTWKLREIKYDHIPYIDYVVRPEVHFIRVDVKTFNKKIGYIPGAGDKVPEALEQMGYEVTLLTDKELSKNGIEKYDAIITGVRAYNTNGWMNKHYDKLMKYVNDGGNLIVQYNTSNQIGPVRAKIGPYPFEITRNRVTDEQATVTILNPAHPVFNFPNRITDDDFKGWIQERSIYHGKDSTGKFEKLLSMHDPGEVADDGSLLVARYGKGWFTYTGLVFFRELPAGIPGAYRLLANIIALNRKKGF